MFRRKLQKVAPENPAIQEQVVLPEQDANTLPALLRAPLDRVASHEAESGRIRKALENARSVLRDAERATEAARAALVSVEAEAALDPAVSTTEARAGIVGARDLHEIATARITGLEIRLQSVEAELANAREDLRIAWDGWTAAELRDYAAEFRQAVDQFAAVVRRGFALAAGIGGGGVTTRVIVNLRGIDVGDPITNEQLLGRALQDSWRDDPEAVRVHGQVMAIRDAVRTPTKEPEGALLLTA